MLGWYQDAKVLKIISKPNAATGEGRLWRCRWVPVEDHLARGTSPAHPALQPEPGQPGSLCVLHSRRPSLALLTWDWHSFYPQKWIRLEAHWVLEASAVRLRRGHFDEEIFLFPQKTWSETSLWKYDSRLISSEPHIWFVRAEFKMTLVLLSWSDCAALWVSAEWGRQSSAERPWWVGAAGASSSPWSLLAPEQPLEVGLLSLWIFFFNFQF